MDGTDADPARNDTARDDTARDDTGDTGRTAGTAAGADADGVFAVRDRTGWRGVWRALALAILFLASVGFASGGVVRGLGFGSAVFVVLGAAGVVLFGWGLLVALGELTARRPVLEFDAAGVRRPARWPLPKRAARTLPWDDVAAMAAIRRGVTGARGGVRDHLVFLPTPELAELARTAERPALVALTLRDVPATAAAEPWAFSVEPGWDASLAEVVKQARRRRRIPVIDRRTK
ncbi:hypothetical protein [Actinomadura sediminis]|uniref:Uncharacterized protein n=1 Tax=Actinomadura sediminis TaxID=1038904 RepID=A0ABW3EMC1_9ACTN